MSRAQAPHRPILSFGNPFRMISPKGSRFSPKLLPLLNTFEETLSGRIKKLKPSTKEEVLHMPWMRRAVETLCEIHNDVKNLITALELPICDWEDKWVDAYLDNSVKLLDICIAFTSEIARLKQGDLYLRFATHSKQFPQARSSLDAWKEHVSSKNPRLDKCFALIDEFSQKLDLPKIKNSAKGKILMRAMYGLKAVNLLICSIFAAAFSGSAINLIDLKISEPFLWAEPFANLQTFLWAEPFASLQTFVNTEIRSLYSSGSVTVLKEVEAVDNAVKKFYPIGGEVVGPLDIEKLGELASDIKKSGDNLAVQLDLLGKEVDRFFRIVLTGRDALLSNLRAGSDVFYCKKNSPVHKVCVLGGV